MVLGDDATTVGLRRTPDGRKLVVERTVQAAAETCWDLLVDTRRWPEWGPSITAVESERRYVAAGTRGRVRTVGGLWLPFEITACEDGRWTWRVARIPATGHRVAGDDPCTVGFEVPLVAVGYVPVCVRALRRIESLATGGRETER